MTAYNAKHPYEPDWQIPRGVWAKLLCNMSLPQLRSNHKSSLFTSILSNVNIVSPCNAVKTLERRSSLIASLLCAAQPTVHEGQWCNITFICNLTRIIVVTLTFQVRVQSPWIWKSWHSLFSPIGVEPWKRGQGISLRNTSIAYSNTHTLDEWHQVTHAPVLRARGKLALQFLYSRNGRRLHSERFTFHGGDSD